MARKATLDDLDLVKSVLSADGTTPYAHANAVALGQIITDDWVVTDGATVMHIVLHSPQAPILPTDKRPEVWIAAWLPFCRLTKVTVPQGKAALIFLGAALELLTTEHPELLSATVAGTIGFRLPAERLVTVLLGKASVRVGIAGVSNASLVWGLVKDGIQVSHGI